MSVAEAISNRIKYMEKGKPFASALFAKVGTRASVDKALSRLVQTGTLERVTRGVYMRPKFNEFVGKNVRPSPTTVMQVIARSKGETIQIHGSEAVRRLGLSTQMQMQPTFYTSGSTRVLKVGNAVVRLQHVAKNRLQGAGTNVGMALSALYYIGRAALTRADVRQILKALSPEEIQQLRACKMPEWMRAAVQAA